MSHCRDLTIIHAAYSHEANLRSLGWSCFWPELANKKFCLQIEILTNKSTLRLKSYVFWTLDLRSKVSHALNPYRTCFVQADCWHTLLFCWIRWPAFRVWNHVHVGSEQDCSSQELTNSVVDECYLLCSSIWEANKEEAVRQNIWHRFGTGHLCKVRMITLSLTNWSAVFSEFYGVKQNKKSGMK